MQNDLASPLVEDEIDLKEIAVALWRGKTIIIAIVSVCAILAVTVALLIPNQYKATAVVAPAQSSSSSALGAMASRLGGLATLAGINVGSGDNVTEAQTAIEIMQSWQFIETFVQSHNLQAAIFAADGWDSQTNQITFNSDIYDSERDEWIRKPPSGKTAQPTSWELYQEFSNRLSVSTEKTSGLITISIEYYSPILAQQWVELYISSINAYMRERKLTQVNNNIDYLKAQITKTAFADMKEVFYQIIEEQIKSKMLAEASPEYAFVTVNPAMVPEEKSSPKRALICLLVTFLGFMLAVFIVLIRHYATSTNVDIK